MNTIRIHFYEVRNDDYESRGRSRNLRPPLYKERNHATAVKTRTDYVRAGSPPPGPLGTGKEIDDEDQTRMGRRTGVV